MDSENRMSVRRALILPALALLAAGCADTHPTAVQQPATLAPHFLRWAGSLAPQFRVIDATSGQSAGGNLPPNGSGGLRFEFASGPCGISLHRPTAQFLGIRVDQRFGQ